MTSEEFRACVHPREFPRFVLALLFALPITIALILLSVFSFGMLPAFILGIAFLIWFAFEVSYSLFIANAILVSEYNYPRAFSLLNETKERMSVRNRIDMLVYQQGEFNAYFSMLFARRAIFLNSELLEQGVSDDELRWIIGRFVGRIRAKRRMGPLSLVIALAERLLVFNLFIYPYIRATAYTGDRVALANINGDISTAISAMNKLLVGRQLGYSVNPAGIVIQYKRVKGSLFAFLARLASPLPHTLPRYFDLITFAAQRYPAEYAKFAAMNPNFQTAGGPEKLLLSAPRPSYAGQGLGSGAVGAMLFFGAIGLSVVSIGVTATFMSGMSSPFAGIFGAPPIADYPSAYDLPPPDLAMEPPMSTEDYAATAPVAETAASAWAAYAISDSRNYWGAGWNWPSQSEAEQEAVGRCGGGDCRVLMSFADMCGAIAYGGGSAWFVRTGASADDARSNVQSACQQQSYSCEILNATCASQQ